MEEKGRVNADATSQWSPDDEKDSPRLRSYDRKNIMTKTARQVESRALRLSAAARARLAERLISSLDQGDPDAEKLSAEEAERRLEELRSGAVKSRPAEGVFRKARTALR